MQDFLVGLVTFDDLIDDTDGERTANGIDNLKLTKTANERRTVSIT